MSSEDANSPDPVKRSDALTERIAESGLPTIVDGVVKTLRRTRKLVWWTAGTVAFDLIISVILAVVAIQARHTAIEVKRSTNAAVINCQAANQARETERSLWNFILSLPPTNTQTPEQKAAVEQETAQLKEFLRVNLTTRDCGPQLTKPVPVATASN